MIAAMSDILADYRIWKSQQEERIGTHSKRCHLWPRHERCMIHRLAAELEKSRQAIRRLAEQDATLSVCDGNVTVTMDATLTDEERAALRTVIGGFGMWVAQNGLADDESLRLAVVTLRGLLERSACGE